MEPLRELTVVRGLAAPATCRAAGAAWSEDPPILDLRFSPFGKWYRIDSAWEGTFLERTRPGAFRKTIRESGSALKIMFNHGHDPQIGEKLLGTPTRVAEEDDSPVAEVPLWDTSYNRDLLPGLRAGAYGSSFMFQALAHVWVEEPGQSEWNPEGIPERTITEVRLFEAGPVTWPANPAATSAARSGVWSETDNYYEALAARGGATAERVHELRARALARTPERRAPAADEAPLRSAPEAAPAPDREPARSHSSTSTPNHRADWLTAFRARHLER